MPKGFKNYAKLTLSFCMVHAEFCAMVGEDTTETMERRWATFIPIILRLGDQDENEDASYKALHV